jgi:Family of unknown function (DUF6982)
MSHGSHEPAKVVARFADQRVVKGYTFNFDPNKPMFTLKTLGSRPDEDPTPIQLSDLKAVFFVRDFVGNPEYNDRKEFVDPARGRKLAVTFKDGEVMVGTSFGYDPLIAPATTRRPSFFERQSPMCATRDRQATSPNGTSGASVHGLARVPGLLTHRVWMN